MQDNENTHVCTCEAKPLNLQRKPHDITRFHRLYNMRQLKKGMVWWRSTIPAFTLTAATLAAILWLTLARTPLPETDLPTFPGADKLVHAVMFGTLTVIACWDWYASRRRALCNWQISLCAIVAIALGGGIEIEQGAMGNGRSADILDFVADTIGALAAMAIVMSRNRKTR